MKNKLIIAYATIAILTGSLGYAVNTVITLTKAMVNVEKIVKANRVKRVSRATQRAGRTALSAVPIIGTIVAVAGAGYLVHDFCESEAEDDKILSMIGADTSENPKSCVDRMTEILD